MKLSHVSFNVRQLHLLYCYMRRRLSTVISVAGSFSFNLRFVITDVTHSQRLLMNIIRTIEQALLEWNRETTGRKALLIEGARRVGKSTLAERFAKEQYKSYILIDFNLALKSVKDSFLLSTESKTRFRVSPVEVKSSKNYTTASFQAFKAAFSKRVGRSIIVHSKSMEL